MRRETRWATVPPRLSCTLRGSSHSVPLLDTNHLSACLDRRVSRLLETQLVAHLLQRVSAWLARPFASNCLRALFPRVNATSWAKSSSASSPLYTSAIRKALPPGVRTTRLSCSASWRMSAVRTGAVASRLFSQGILRDSDEEPVMLFVADRLDFHGGSGGVDVVEDPIVTNPQFPVAKAFSGGVVACGKGRSYFCRVTTAIS